MSTSLSMAPRIRTALAAFVLKADFTLTKKSTGQVLKTGHRSAVALVDFNTQEYAKIRANPRRGKPRCA